MADQSRYTLSARRCLSATLIWKTIMKTNVKTTGGGAAQSETDEQSATTLEISAPKRSLAHWLDNKICRMQWWMHKRAFTLSLVFGLIAFFFLVMAVLDVATGPRRADFGASFLIYLAIMIATSLISAACAPKAKEPDVVQAKAPTVKDGTGVVRVYGTVWIDDSIVLGWQQLGTTPIKSNGGKK